MKIVCLETYGGPNPVFPPGAKVQYLAIQCAASLQIITTAKKNEAKVRPKASLRPLLIWNFD